MFPRRLEDVFKTCLQDVFKICLQDIFKICLQDVFKPCLQDVFKTSWRPANVCWIVFCGIFRKRYSGYSGYRSSPPKVFLGIGILKICSKFIEEHPCQSVISIKLQNKICCIFPEHLFFWTLLGGCFWGYSNKQSLPRNRWHIYQTEYFFMESRHLPKKFTMKKLLESLFSQTVFFDLFETNTGENKKPIVFWDFKKEKLTIIQLKILFYVSQKYA